MSRDVNVQCRCGEVRGKVENASAQTGNHVICYCDDCQAFLHHLERGDLLDEHGGSDIVQVSPASYSFERGKERIVGLRLSPKGLYRWYAECCKTPLGNTTGPAIPFVGIMAQAFEGGVGGAGDVFGKPIGAIAGKFAVGTAPEGSTGLNVRLLAHTARLILGWRLGGRAWPNPFFDRATRSPNRAPAILSTSERDALRPLCGPHPTKNPVSIHANGLNRRGPDADHSR